MRECQLYDVAGKIKSTFKKRGAIYTRKGYDVRVTTAERFKKKCDLLGEPESKVVEMLVESFLTATGWGPEVKQASFFEPRISEHVREASRQVAKDTYFS